MKRFNLKYKFFTLTFLMGLVLILVIFFFVQFRLTVSIEEHEMEQLNSTLHSHVQEVEKNFSQYSMLTQMIAEKRDLLDYLKEESSLTVDVLRNKFLSYHDFDEEILSIYLLDINGETLVSTDQSFEGNNYGYRDYFQESLKGTPYMDTAIGKTSNEFGFYFSYPVLDEDSSEVLGVLVLKSSDRYIYKLLQNSGLTVNGRVLLFDEDGIILISSYPEFVLSSIWPLNKEEKMSLSIAQRFAGKTIQSLPYEEIKPMVKSYYGREGMKITRYDDNHELFVIIEKINNYPFFMMASADLTLIRSQIYSDLLSPVLLALIIVLLISFLIYLATLKFFVNPLQSLVLFSKNIAFGNFEEKIKLRSNDELMDLGEAMNKMVERLKSYYSDLAKEVNKKTKEINKNNKELEEQKLAILNILEDVDTEKKKVEELAKDLEKFKLALDNASDHIVITDADGIALYGNKGVERTTGYKLKEVIGKKAGKLWALPMPARFYKTLWKTIKEDKKIFEGELKNKRKNGEVYDALVSISPILNKKNEVEFFIGIERDITKEKEIDRAKTEFVSLASHQLRTPLSSINWYAEMLLDGDAGKLSTNQKDFVSEMYKSNQRMVDLVNSLLNVSRIELGTFAVEPEDVNVVDVAKDVISELKAGIKKKKMNVKFDYDKDIPVISADPKLIRIIFQNLLSNAIKYTPEKGKVNLDIKKDKNNLIIKVKDNGFGIPKSNQEKIFTKLFRADNVKIKDTEGTGLGLYIVKSIIDHAEGSIKFDSEENKGTEFIVSMPLSGMKKKKGDKNLNNSK